MMISDMRLDISRYKTRFSDWITETYENGDVSVHITEKGNVLVTKKEPYITEATKEDCPDKDEIFDMVKFVVHNEQVISGDFIEMVLREGDLSKTEALRQAVIGKI